MKSATEEGPLPFTINPLKYISYYSQNRNNDKKEE
jgi:hypothetical protein